MIPEFLSLPLVAYAQSKYVFRASSTFDDSAKFVVETHLKLMEGCVLSPDNGWGRVFTLARWGTLTTMGGGIPTAESLLCPRTKVV